MSQAKLFKSLHFTDEVLFLPNAWDVLSAKVFEQAGFKAVGTTSWGVANSLGYNDGEKIGFDQLLSLSENIIKMINIPLTVDIESGYASHTNTIVNNVLRLADRGVSGINIEDSFKTKKGLKDVSEHSRLIYEIRTCLDKNSFTDVFINTRIDSYFQMENPLHDAIQRAKSYASHGADGVFVPGVSNISEIQELVDAIDVPLNVLSLPNLTDTNTLQRIGVKRFSIGNAFSDEIIKFMEKTANHLKQSLSTEFLYTEGKIATVFK